jgi:hypothetical protein
MGRWQMRLKLGRDDDPHPENAIDKLEIRHFRDPHVLGLPRAGADNPRRGLWTPTLDSCGVVQVADLLGCQAMSDA